MTVMIVTPYFQKILNSTPRIRTFRKKPSTVITIIKYGGKDVE